MPQLSEWIPQEVEAVMKSHPEQIVHPIPGYGDRCSLLVGELVKIIVRVDDADDSSSLYRRWVVIHSIGPGEPPQYIGDLQSGPGGRMPPNGSTTIEFGPNHVYRMPPRTFTLWGNTDTPVRIAGNRSRPCDPDGNELHDCGNVILEFNALGWDAALAHYSKLAKSRPHWPKQIA